MYVLHILHIMLVGINLFPACTSVVLTKLSIQYLLLVCAVRTFSRNHDVKVVD